MYVKLRAKTMRVNGYDEVLGNQTLSRHTPTRFRICCIHKLDMDEARKDVE